MPTRTKWGERKKGSPRQIGQKYQKTGSGMKGAKKSAKYEPTKIKVTEWHGRGLGKEGVPITDIVDEKKFENLYGKQDLDQLKREGAVGDTIGQNKYYTAKIVSKDKPPSEIRAIFNSLNESEKFGVAFGMFPARLELTHHDVVALMEMREEKGQPRMIFDEKRRK